MMYTIRYEWEIFGNADSNESDEEDDAKKTMRRVKTLKSKAASTINKRR